MQSLRPQPMQEALEAARFEIDRLRDELISLQGAMTMQSEDISFLQAENKTLKLAQSLIPATVDILN